MKRQAVTALFATLILCFWSNSVFADMNIYFFEHYGESDAELFIYNGDHYCDKPSNSCDFLNTVSHTSPCSYYILHEETYDDGMVSGRGSVYFGYAFKENTCTDTINIDCWVNNIQGVESLSYSANANAHVDHIFKMSADAILKIKISGATWNETVDPYFTLHVERNETPLVFDYDGTYYTTYLNSRESLFWMYASLSSPYLSNTNFTRDCQIEYTFVPVPVPSAVLLGLIGLGYSGLRLRRKTE